MKIRRFIILVLPILFGCNFISLPGGAGGLLRDDPVPTASVTATPTPFQPIAQTPTSTVTSTPTATQTFTATITPTVTLTHTPRPTIARTATPEWPWNEPGQANMPVLLYHHIADVYNPYYLTPDAFRDEMAYLSEQGYESITVALLAEAITSGANLPPRPVIITFDDGNLSVYENAYPILSEFGFTATIYLVGNYLGTSGHLSVGQVNELSAAGWEVGSHSMNHYDLRGATGLFWNEIAYSRQFLEETLGVQVQSFAYPYGGLDYSVVDYTSRAGYVAGMGLGSSWQHSHATLYDLDRIEMRYGTDLATFISRLPW